MGEGRTCCEGAVSQGWRPARSAPIQRMALLQEYGGCRTSSWAACAACNFSDRHHLGHLGGGAFTLSGGCGPGGGYGAREKATGGGDDVTGLGGGA